MRLLNTKTLVLEEFLNETVTEYAILSHTWCNDEVSFADIASLETARKRDGFAKLVGFCEVARAAGYDYGWIDTCCIDKSSTTELSEAISSMFRWYQRSAVCYAYLSDVHRDGDPDGFVQSRWFKRGWTLQELLAPKDLVFYDVDWKTIGLKSQLISHIHTATGIAESAIKHFIIKDYCVAEKMSWAAQRVTTRPEDIAYSLLGLFDVTMPMLYGEGEKAFIRLQELILKDTDDRSIFAWSGFRSQYSGVLAHSPAFFKALDVTSGPLPTRFHFALPYMITNVGLSIKICLWPVAYKTYLAAINPPRNFDVSAQNFCLFLRWAGPAQYVRTSYGGSDLLRGSESPVTDHVSMSIRRRHASRPFAMEQIMIQHHLDESLLWHIYTQTPDRTPNFCIKTLAPPGKQSLRLVKADTFGTWKPRSQLLKLEDGHFGTAGVFTFDQPRILGAFMADSPRKVLLGFGFDFFPVCVIMNAKGSKGMKAGVSYQHSHKVSTTLRRCEIEDITCLESTGWSRVADGVIDEVEDRPGVWAVRLESYDGFKATFSDNNWYLEIALEIADGWQWMVTIGESPERKPHMSWRPQYRPLQLEWGRALHSIRNLRVSGDTRSQETESNYA